MSKATERSVAQTNGEMHYFTGRPCSRGHVAKRRTVNGSCIECECENDRKRVRPEDYGKEKYWADPEKAKKQRRENYLKHREARIAYSSQWARENPDKANARTSRWRKANSGKVNAQTAKRRAALARATPLWLTAEHCLEMRTIYMEAIAKGMEVDHEVPIRGENVCGLHVPWNLQLLPLKENRSKGNKYVS